MYGTNWPPREFSELPSEDVVAFWRNPARGEKALDALVRKTVVAKKVKEESQAANSEYKPLGFGYKWVSTRVCGSNRTEIG